MSDEETPAPSHRDIVQAMNEDSYRSMRESLAATYAQMESGPVSDGLLVELELARERLSAARARVLAGRRRLRAERKA